MRLVVPLAIEIPRLESQILDEEVVKEKINKKNTA